MTKSHPCPHRSGIGRTAACAVLLSLFFSNGLESQPVAKHKANTELAERFTSEKMSKMIFDTTVEPHWLEHSRCFWYRYRTTQGVDFYLVDPVKKTKKPVFDNAHMASLLTQLTRNPYDPQHHPIETITFVNRDRAVRFDVDDMRFEYDLASRKLTRITEEEEKEPPEWACFSPDKKTILYAYRHDLYMLDADDPDAEPDRLTEDGATFYSYAHDDTDTDHEKRKKVSVSWSPDSRKFAFIRTDARKIKPLWLINCLSTPRPTLETYPYVMPGDPDVPRHELYVFDRETKSRLLIPTDRWKDQALYQAESTGPFRSKPYLWWGDSSREVYFGRRSRDYRKLDLCAADTAAGTVRVLIEERLNTYIETLSPHILDGGRELIFWSERDGWGHFYLYDGSGRLKNRITSGPFSCRKIVHLDQKNRVLYFTACGKDPDENPYQHHLYRVNLDGTGMKQLNPEDAEHRSHMHPSGDYFVDNISRVDTTPRSVLRDNQGRKLLDLETADLTSLQAAGFRFCERFHLKADDGITDLYGVMYKPFDFDSGRRYPVIIYVYPGPQTESVPLTFRDSLRHVALTQCGFIVVCVGNRGGHPERSKWYHNYGYENFRDYGLADKKYALEQLAARHAFIDIDRVGIFGHSGGGFMSTAAMLVYPNFFKVAVSSSGNHDNPVFDMYWNEKHNGVKEIVEENGETRFVYDVDTNSEIAHRLQGRLLLVTGDMDNNVHHANTIRVADALIKANKRFDMFIFPGQRHHYGKMEDYFFWLRADYFCRHLIGDRESSVDIHQLNAPDK